MKYVLITGATSGIGYEFAKIFAREGYGLALVATNDRRLKEVSSELKEAYKVPIYTYVQDLGQICAANTLYEKVQVDRLPISILINNAGRGLVGPTEVIDLEQDEQLMILNMINVVALSKLFIKDMYHAGSGKILNVASTGAFQPGPYTSTYFASKAFVLSYSRAIRYEARKRGIQVSILCPGATRTQFFKREGMKVPQGAMSAEVVAEYAYKCFMKNKEVIVPGFINKLLRVVPVKIKMYGVAKMKGLK